MAMLRTCPNMTLAVEQDVKPQFVYIFGKDILPKYSSKTKSSHFMQILHQRDQGHNIADVFLKSSHKSRIQAFRFVTSHAVLNFIHFILIDKQ